MIQFNPMTLAFTVFLIALLNGCNASSYEPVKSEPIGTVVEQKKIHLIGQKLILNLIFLSTIHHEMSTTQTILSV